jgi:anti-sigma regulatory factor (Ser/Thr protein kinase)
VIEVTQTFPGTAPAPGAARAWLAGRLGPAPFGCGYPRAGDASVCVSELAVNAVLHTRSGMPGGAFAVVLTLTADAIVVTVTDLGPRPPGDRAVVSRPEPGEGGHGLTLVAALADAYGQTRGQAWFRMAWPDDPQPIPARQARADEPLLAGGPDITHSARRRADEAVV